MSEIAVSINSLWKQYRLGKKKSGSLRDSLGNIFQRKPESHFWALKDINFEIPKGKAVGIVGANGAGKSTLLKVLSKITYPTKGRVEIEGRVSSLLEVGTGFHPELTGRQNVFLNGTILGMTKKEIQLKFDEIVAFSGVEKFIDTAVKHYSSGMKVRLAFAVAAHLEPEILIVDEVLAVGDAEFQKKCLGKMEDAAGEGRTVLFVSHNMQALKTLCSEGILLRSGEVYFKDKIQNVINEYLGASELGLNQTYDLSLIEERKGNQEVKFMSLKYSKPHFESNENIELEITFSSTQEVFPSANDIDLGINVQGSHGMNLMHFSNRFIHKVIPYVGKEKKLKVKIENVLKPGVYSLSLFLRINGIIQDWMHSKAPFEVVDSNPYGYSNTSEIQGAIYPRYSIDEV